MPRKPVILSVPHKCIGANQLAGAGRYAYRVEKAQLSRDLELIWLAAGRPTWNRARVVVRCYFGAGARRDPANYLGSGSAKWAIDTLTRLGAWVDDGPKYVTVAGCRCIYRRDTWELELEISEWEDEQEGVVPTIQALSTKHAPTVTSSAPGVVLCGACSNTTLGHIVAWPCDAAKLAEVVMAQTRGDDEGYAVALDRLTNGAEAA